MHLVLFDIDGTLVESYDFDSQCYMAAIQDVRRVAAGPDCSRHHSRIEIMQLAERRAGSNRYASRTYFGDGPWDQKAADALGYNFVSVGNRITSLQSIGDYTEFDKAMGFIGL